MNNMHLFNGRDFAKILLSKTTKRNRDNIKYKINRDINNDIEFIE